MISRKIAHTLDDHLIEFCIVFSPLRLGSYERLSIDGNVVAESTCSRSRKQCILKADVVIGGVTRHIMAVSAPMKSSIKQGIQIRIDNEFVSGDAELDVTGDEDECASFSGAAQAGKGGSRILTIVKTYVALLVIFALFMIKRNGFGFLGTMSADELLFFLAIPAVISVMYFAALGIVRRLFR